MSGNSIIRSTWTVAVSTLISRIMGFIRDMIIAGIFGASAALDGFFIAFRIPNLLRRLVGEGALTISFIPVYTDYLVNRGEQEAQVLAQKTLSILILVLTGIVALGIILSPELVDLFAYGFENKDVINLTVGLNRIMFPYLGFVGFVAFAMGVLNSHNYFFAPAFSPVLLNVGFIIGAVLLRHLFTEPLYGLAWGVVLGGIMQMVLQLPYLLKSGFKMRFSIDFRHPGIRKIFAMIAPALFGIAVYQINIFMSTVLASMLPGGSISYLYYSDRLTELVLGIFIISIGNVILPEMSKISAREDMSNLKKLYLQSVSTSLFLAVPATLALMAIGLPIVSVLFMRGEFTSYHADMTAKALFYASMGIASLSVLRITTPVYYSLKDTKTPVLSAAVSFVLNISLGYFLMRTTLIHAGLSLANSIAVTVQSAILLVFLRKKIGPVDLKSLGPPLAKMLLSGIIMTGIIYYMAGLTDWHGETFISRLISLSAIILAGGSVYFLLCFLFRIKEVLYLFEWLKKRSGRL